MEFTRVIIVQESLRTPPSISVVMVMMGQRRMLVRLKLRFNEVTIIVYLVVMFFLMIIFLHHFPLQFNIHLIFFLLLYLFLGHFSKFRLSCIKFLFIKVDFLSKALQFVIELGVDTFSCGELEFLENGLSWWKALDLSS